MPKKNNNTKIHCQNCSISQLCIPNTLDEYEISLLDTNIERKKPLQKGEVLFKSGQQLNYLYAIRTGSIKCYSVSECGEEQIASFYLQGDLIGLDSLNNLTYNNYAQALETTMICEIPFQSLNDLITKFPKLRQQVMRLMSSEIKNNQNMILLLSKKSAEARLAAFVYNLSKRFCECGLSQKEFKLSMTRSDIANYLGLTVETISRTFSKLQKQEILKVKGKFLSIYDLDKLAKIAGLKI